MQGDGFGGESEGDGAGGGGEAGVCGGGGEPVPVCVVKGVAVMLWPQQHRVGGSARHPPHRQQALHAPRWLPHPPWHAARALHLFLDDAL